MSTKDILIFDIIGFIISLIVIISNLDIKKYQMRKRRLIEMTIAIAVAIFVDGISHLWLSRLNNNFGVVSIYILNSIHYLSMAFIMFDYTRYAAYLIWQEDCNQKFLTKIGLSLFIVDCFSIILNLIRPFLFEVSIEKGFVQNDVGYYLFVGFNFLMYLASIIVLYFYKDRVNKGFVPVIIILTLPLTLPNYTSLISDELNNLTSVFSVATLVMFYLIQGTRVFNDEFTGITNRTYLSRKLIFWYQKEEDINVSSIILNISQMPLINDKYGHELGDQVIKTIANIVYKVYLKYPNTIPIRFKGNDFLLTWVENDPEQYEKMKVDLLEYINKELYFKEKDFKVDVSVGYFTLSTKESKSYKKYLHEIDEKILLVKNELGRMIDEYIKEDKFFIYYQPIFDLKTNKFEAAEALLRCRDKDGNFVNPETVVNAAEKTGQIIKLGEIITEKVCRFCSCEEFKKLGIKTMDINLSIVQCLTKNLAKELIKIVNKFKIPDDEICFELTESAIISKEDAFRENVEIIHNNEIKLSLDDFGKGYSNLQRIATIPLNVIKIDQSITKNIDDPKTKIILDNIIKMIKDLNIKIVVEGVETTEQLEFFKKYDVDMIQGYYYSKPISEDDFIEFINNYSKNS